MLLGFLLVAAAAVAAPRGVSLVRGEATTSALASAEPTYLVPWGASGYRYKQVAHNELPEFWKPDFVNSDWAVDPAPFGNGGCHPRATEWEAGTEAAPTNLLVRRTFTVPAGTDHILVHVAIDNDVTVHVNGRYNSGLEPGNATSCQAYGPGVANVRPLRVDADDLLLGGENVLAVRGLDYGGATYLDVAVTIPAPAPEPLTATKTADASSVAPGGANGYTITLDNPNAEPVSVASITDDVPEGFSYAGPTIDATTSDPTVEGQKLTWSGPFTVPGAGSISLHFGVTAATTPGTYSNTADALDENGQSLATTGPTAEIVVAEESAVPCVTPSTEGSATGGVQTWRLSGDFSASNTNPAPDSYGNANVWHFCESGLASTAEDFRLPSFDSNMYDTSGQLKGWRGTVAENCGGAPDRLPFIAVNTGDTAITPKCSSIEFPANAAAVHPSSQRMAIVAWRSPVAGSIRISGGVADNDAGVPGDGVRWFIAKGATDPNALAGGAIENGGSQSFPELTVPVDVGDVLYVGVHPGSAENRSFDTTRLDLTLTLGESPPTQFTITKTADAARVFPGAATGYTITVTNPSAEPATVDSITDELPVGFSYAGPTTDATTSDPTVAGQKLTWNGPFEVPAEGTLKLHFGVTAAGQPGSYLNRAGAEDETGESLATTGPTAEIVVIGDPCEQTGTTPGGIFLTGHDAEAHAGDTSGLSDVDGAKHIVQRAIGFTTDDKPAPKILLVAGTTEPQVQNVDPRVGLRDSGFGSFDVAHAGPAEPGVALDLSSVSFGAYDVVVVASDAGHWLTDAESKILIARTAELVEFVNAGGGLVAFSESAAAARPFGFLPFVVSAQPAGSTAEAGATLTPYGRDVVRLDDGDIDFGGADGNYFHNTFASTGGLEVADYDARGQILSLATRRTRLAADGPCGIDVSILKTDAPDPARVGEELRYTLTVKNETSGTTAAAVTVTDTLPADIELDPAPTITPSQGSCNLVERSMTCDLGELPSTTTVTIEIVVRPTKPGTLVNAAEVTAPNDPNTANNRSEATTTVEAPEFLLRVIRAGTGTGSVAGSPAGIDCRDPDPDCSEAYAANTVVTLTATPADDSEFAGWSGDCTADHCRVTMDAAKEVTATFTKKRHELSVVLAGSGSGTVTSPPDIDCGGVCSATYDHGAVVELSATPAADSEFAGWSGACDADPCQVTMDAARDVTATFRKKIHRLAVERAGTGTGTVASTPAGVIDCGTVCSATGPHGSTLTLTATPAEGSEFTGWSGDCSGTDPCELTLDEDKLVVASFERKRYELTVNKAGTGSGAVTSLPGIDCGADCSESYDHGTLVELRATPAADSEFAGWSGDCTNATGPCEVTMDAAKEVTATFTKKRHLLIVAKAGSGAGTVTSAPGIDCGSDCSETYDHDTAVELTATPAAGSDFTGWSGACTNASGPCEVTMDASRNVIATFTTKRHLLIVAKAGTGTGTVTGAGINCGGDCSESYDHGTVVTLTATPAAGSEFTGWSGACVAPSGPCVVTMDASKNVVATFTTARRVLIVARAGSGTGTVTGAGIDCGPDCSETYDHGTVVTLTATPAAGSTFTGWTGACVAPSGPCVVTMDASKNVVATFTSSTSSNHLLIVAKAGNGSGTVRAPGIDCGSDCSESYPPGTRVRLVAIPAQGSEFEGWTGACTNAARVCVITISASRTVIATFRTPLQRLTVFASNGRVTSSPAGITCGNGGSDCFEEYPRGTQVILAATPAPGYEFAGWGFGCSNPTGTCRLTMNRPTIVLALFRPVLQRLRVFVFGGGTVSSDPPGIDGCTSSSGPNCFDDYPRGTRVTLTATPAPGFEFAGWDLGCRGRSSTCQVTVNATTLVFATFRRR